MSFLVYVTVPHEREALDLARMLVEARLAAGVNVLPGARSVYRWQGEVREAGECLLLAQVGRAAFEDFCAATKCPVLWPCPWRPGTSPFCAGLRKTACRPWDRAF